MNDLTYSRAGDYLLPDLTLAEPPEELTDPIGKYGLMRKNYLKQHRGALYNSLLLQEKLYPHLREIDQTANSRMERLTAELAKAQGVTEQLKAQDQMKWVGMMNNIHHQAEETILSELIYS